MTRMICVLDLHACLGKITLQENMAGCTSLEQNSIVENIERFDYVANVRGHLAHLLLVQLVNAYAVGHGQDKGRVARTVHNKPTVQDLSRTALRAGVA